MKKTIQIATACALAMAALGASAQEPAPKEKPFYITLDHSTGTLVDASSGAAVWKEAVPAKLFKMYPIKKFGFLTEVEGGFNTAKTCVITARAMMLPRKGKDLIFKPVKTATTFDAKPGASAEQCKELAQAKRKEAIQAVIGALAGS
jgi:hypothetical protein